MEFIGLAKVCKETFGKTTPVGTFNFEKQVCKNISIFLFAIHHDRDIIGIDYCSAQYQVLMHTAGVGISKMPGMYDYSSTLQLLIKD